MTASAPSYAGRSYKRPFDHRKYQTTTKELRLYQMKLISVKPQLFLFTQTLSDLFLYRFTHPKAFLH